MLHKSYGEELSCGAVALNSLIDDARSNIDGPCLVCVAFQNFLFHSHILLRVAEPNMTVVVLLHDVMQNMIVCMTILSWFIFMRSQNTTCILSVLILLKSES